MGPADQRRAVASWAGVFRYRMKNQYDRAIAQCRFAIELAPNFPMAYWQLGIAYAHKGLLDEAISTAEKAIELFGRYSFLLMCLGVCYASAGRPAEARNLLEELKTRGHVAYLPSYAIGTIHLALGEIDQGLEW